MSDMHEAERAARREAEDAELPPEPDAPTGDEIDAASHALVREQAAGAAEATEIDVEAGTMLEGEEVDGEPVEPEQEVSEALELAHGAAAAIVAHPEDRHEGLVAMDANDSRLFLERLTAQAQREHLGKAWVYKLPGREGAEGLTVDAVNDVTQLMNWTGLCSIGIVPGTLKLEQVDGDEDGEPVKMWMATIEARDAKTGAVVTGTATEPQRLKLKPATAKAKRADGKQIPEDDRVFDKFAATKAANKAERNAKGKFIPTVVEQHILAMASNRPELIERIGSEAEEKAAERPPAVTGPEADALLADCEGIYTQIRALGKGKGAQAFPPGRYYSELMQSQHSLATLRAFKARLVQRREELATHYAKAAGDESAG